MEDRHYDLCTDRDIKKLYQRFAKKDFGKHSIGMLMKRDVYVLTERNGIFTNSCQGKGVFVFTDLARARAFLAKEENATANTWFTRIWFTQMWMRACDMGLSIYINLTPPGDKTLSAHFVPDAGKDGLWFPCCKDSQFRYTLPYNLKPNHKKHDLTYVKRII